MDILSSNIPHLTRTDFSPCGSLTRYTSGVATVLFYTNSSRFSQTFIPEYEKLPAMCDGNCQALAVNMDQGTNNAIYSMSTKFPYTITNFPTVVLYFNGDPCSIYLGERTASSLFSQIKTITNKQQCKFKFVPCE